MKSAAINWDIQDWPERAGHRPIIHVVGPNPAMDRTEELGALNINEVNRALASSPRAGGKGFIVARALIRLEHSASLYGFLGGAVGSYLRRECNKLAIRDCHTEIAAETRINTILVNRRTGLATVINEPGPMVTPGEASQLIKKLETNVQAGDLVALSGSLPRGLSSDFYSTLVKTVREQAGLVVLDAGGDVLVNAAQAIPWAIKCNLLEFQALAENAPVDVRSDKDRFALLRCMEDILITGVRIVIVTLGAGGLVAASRDGACIVNPPAVKTKNATGSGDTLLAGFLAACSDGDCIEDALRLGAAAASANAAVFNADIGSKLPLATLIEQTSIRLLRSAQTATAIRSAP